MKLAFSIVVDLFLLVSIYEYFNGIVIDIAFTHVLARNVQSRATLLRILLVKLFIWVSASAILFITLGSAFSKEELRYIRGYFLTIFVLVILPVALIRKRFARWVIRLSKVNTKY